MSDIKKHAWKLIVLAALFGIAGQMDYEDAVRAELAQQAEPKQEHERQYAAREE